ncbi:hypothetical protein BGX21_000897 [Mortierella sp. AD011]|nr:hypothetical protein BGX21_000897 [Mortierella sp. AD011]
MSNIGKDNEVIAIQSLSPIDGEKIEAEDSGRRNETQAQEQKNEVEEEPLTDEILAWRAKMEAVKSPNAIRRWYFESGTPINVTSEKPTRPYTVNNNAMWYSDFPMDGVKLGCYEIVVCVSLKNINTDVVKSIVFDCCPSKDGLFYSMDEESETRIDKEELLALSKDDFTRLRFFRQISHAAETRNHVVFGSGKPDQIISCGPVNPSPSDDPVRLVGYDLSDNGDYAATFYYTDTIAHLDVWDLRSQVGSDNPSTQPHVFNIPFAQTTFEVSEAQEIAIDVSSKGHVALNGAKDAGMSFRVFKSVAVAPADKNFSKPWTLQRSKTVCDGGYYVVTCFYRSDPENTDEDGERFVTSNGCNFVVYSILGEWTQLFSITMQSEIDLGSIATYYNSIQGGYFAWVTSVGVITVWSFETGQPISQIYIGSDSNVGTPCISRDGSLIAIPVKDTIQIRDTFTGVKLGVLKKGVSENNRLELVFGKDHFLTYNTAESTTKKLGTYNVRSVINVHDMSVVKDIDIHQDYHVEYPQFSDAPVFAYTHGSNINIIKMGSILTPSSESECKVDGVCEKNPLEILNFYHDSFDYVENTAGTKFSIETSVTFKRDIYVKEIIVSVEDQGDETRSMTIPLGYNDIEYFGCFIPSSSQLLLAGDECVQLWNISATANRLCELALIWRLQIYPDGPESRDYTIAKIASAAACEHGKNISVALSVASWISGDLTVSDQKEQTETLTIPITKEDTIPTTEESRLLEGHRGLVTLYAYGDADCKKSVLDYMKTSIRSTLKKPAFCLMGLCHVWNPQIRLHIEEMLTELLPRSHITWIPETPLNKETDPLAMILETAKTQPTAITVAKIIMNYCVTRAVRSRNLAFLSPLFGSLHEVMDLIPDEAFECLGRIAFIPVMHRSYIVDNRIVVHPPRLRLRFWEPINESLYLMKDPIMQLNVTPDAPDPSNEKFTRPVFMASFDALWYYTTLESRGKTNDTQETDKLRAVQTTQTTTWWKTLYHMIRLKSRLRIHNYVECYDFNIEFFDNPSIAALVAYKWNTIGFTYWLVRFVFQCFFYALVIIAALMQVHDADHASQLVGLFIAIIVMALVFLWLELLQAIRSVYRYTKSGYNFLDVFTFTLPLIASVDQIVVIYQKNPNGNTRLLSYSVLIVFLHMLFELRINESVCKYVTIIQQVVVEIRIFFILAGGIFAFTIAMQHLFWSCSYGEEGGCKQPTTAFPENFLGALSATYFFMGGVTDPVSSEFATDDWGFHLMMAIFFFFTVILMLNVLIALINVAFTKGDDGWRLVWIESRLRYIESAENMSYHIPGFRQTHNWFPNEIYFTATLQQVREYREKYSKDRNEADLELTEDWLRESVDMDNFVDEDVDSEETGNIDGGKKPDKIGEDSGNYTDANSQDGSPDKVLIRDLNQQVEDLKTEVGSLKLHVTDLQKQLAEQVLAQREQSQSQFEELKNLLLQRPV